jgi:PAS domain S-box-containing protein
VAATERLYRRIVETTLEGVWMANLNGVTTFANPRMARMLATSPEEMIGRSVFDFVFKADRATVRRHFAEFRREPAGKRVEERLRRKDGTELWTLVAASVFRDERGKPVSFLGMFADITDRKRAEAALRKSEAHLQLQISRMPIGYVLWNSEFRALAWNPAAESMFGYREEEARGKHPYDFIVSKEVQPHVDEIWRRLLRGDSTAHSVNTNVTKDGRTIVCEWSNTPIKESDGTVVGVLSMVVDITERRKAEERLRQMMDTLEARVQQRTAELRVTNRALVESEEKYRQVFETIADGAFVFDGRTRRMVEVNEAALRLYGYTREEFLALKHAAVTAEPEDSEASIELALSGAPLQIPLRYHRKKDQTIFPVEISASTFTFKGRPLVCGIIRDITHNVELEREILAISEREQRRLGHDLHDDLCQQLAGIQFLSQTLAGGLAEQKLREAGQAKEIAEMVQRAMTQTRELARGLSPVRFEAEGLADALGELALRTRKVFRTDCRFRGSAAVLVREHTTAIHLYHIAQEAVGNAVKHGKARRIDISLTRNAGSLALKVSDNGVGLPRELPKAAGMGLQIMQYRAGVIGGSLSMHRQPGGGTAVVCKITERPPPLERSSKR